MKVNVEDIQSLIQVFDNSEWSELHIVSDAFEIHLSDDISARHKQRFSRLAATPVQEAAPAPAMPVAAVPASALQASAHTGHLGAAKVPEGLVAVRAPNLGTFYKAPKPGAKPYVEVGQRVEPVTELCVIEVMKLFTAVQAGLSGVVREVLVKDAEMVEFDQALFYIEPDQ